MKRSLSVPDKSIDTLKLEQLKVSFIAHITQETIFSKYLKDSRYSSFFSDVLGYLNKNFLPFSDGYKTIFLYLISSQKLSHTSPDIIANALPTYEESEQTLDFLISREEEFMSLESLQDLAPDHKQDLYKCIVLFIEGIGNFLSDLDTLDTVRSKFASDSAHLILGNSLNELLAGFDEGCYNRMKTGVGFGSELCMFFTMQEMSNIFDDSDSKKISEILNIIHNLMLGKLDNRILKNISVEYINNLRIIISSKRGLLKNLDYMSMDFPTIFSYVSEDNYQRSEFIFYTTERLLNDFETFISIIEREEYI